MTELTPREYLDKIRTAILDGEPVDREQLLYGLNAAGHLALSGQLPDFERRVANALLVLSGVTPLTIIHRLSERRDDEPASQGADQTGFFTGPQPPPPGSGATGQANNGNQAGRGTPAGGRRQPHNK